LPVTIQKPAESAAQVPGDLSSSKRRCCSGSEEENRQEKGGS